jgi:hypothetical protein
MIKKITQKPVFDDLIYKMHIPCHLIYRNVRKKIRTSDRYIVFLKTISGIYANRVLYYAVVRKKLHFFNLLKK